MLVRLTRIVRIRAASTPAKIAAVPVVTTRTFHSDHLLVHDISTGHMVAMPLFCLWQCDSLRIEEDLAPIDQA